MIVRCPVCMSTYDDAESWTICPHGPLSAPTKDYCKQHDLVNCTFCVPGAVAEVEPPASRPMRLVRQAILNLIRDTIIRDGIYMATEPILQSLFYAAPELHGRLWAEFTTAVEGVFQRPINRGAANTCWGEIVDAILRGELDYQRYL